MTPTDVLKLDSQYETTNYSLKKLKGKLFILFNFYYTHITYTLAKKKMYSIFITNKDNFWII